MKAFILLFLISLPSFACLTKSPESIVKAMVNGEQIAGKDCSELPSEPCVCLDGKDVLNSDYIDGALIPNPDKKFARELKEQKELEAEKKAQDDKKTAEAFIDSFEPKGTTIAALRAEIKQYVDAAKKARK